MKSVKRGGGWGRGTLSRWGEVWISSFSPPSPSLSRYIVALELVTVADSPEEHRPLHPTIEEEKNKVCVGGAGEPPNTASAPFVRPSL